MNERQRDVVAVLTQEAGLGGCTLVQGYGGVAVLGFATCCDWVTVWVHPDGCYEIGLTDIRDLREGVR